jgi:glycosyltransferase involved in cell wall biosynthesis
VPSPKTVLHTIETSGLGGAETILIEVAAGVDRERFRSIAAIPSGGALKTALERRGVPTHVVSSDHWWDLKLPLGLASLCRREHVDLVHSHLPDQNFASCLAGALIRRPVIATYHGQLDFWRAKTWRGALKQGVVRRAAAATVGVCESVQSTLLDMQFPKERVRRIYNGIDVSASHRATSARLREAFNWPAETPLIGTIANVRVTKGHEYFVRAARAVVDAFPAARFVAAGDVDATLGPPLMQLVTELGLDEHVKYLGHRSDVHAVLHDLDVFVLASTSEGFPLVLLEAMAASKPVVATRCGGPEEIIWDGVNGRLVPVRDPAALAEAILGILRDPALAQTLRRAGAADAADFSREGMLREYEELYETVLQA